VEECGPCHVFASFTLAFDMIYLLTAIGLSPGGSTHLHTNNTQNNTNNNRRTQITTDVEECGPCHIFVSFTLTFDMIYLLTAIGLSPGGSTHLHTNNTQNNTNNNWCGRVRAVPHLCEFYPGIWYDIFINYNWVVTRWQYTFTYKQYTEQHK